MANRRGGHGARAEAETGRPAAPAHLGAGGRGGEESVGKEAGRRDDSIRLRARRGGAGRERAAGAGRVCRAVDWSQFFGEAAECVPAGPGRLGEARAGADALRSGPWSLRKTRGRRGGRLRGSCPLDSPASAHLPGYPLPPLPPFPGSPPASRISPGLPHSRVFLRPSPAPRASRSRLP